MKRHVMARQTLERRFKNYKKRGGEREKKTTNNKQTNKNDTEIGFCIKIENNSQKSGEALGFRVLLSFNYKS